jgi:acyl carrier protein
VNPTDFCELLAKTLETPDDLRPETPLLDIVEFDSMGQVSVRAMADERFHRILSDVDLKKCVTVSDLQQLLEEKA